MNNIFLSQVEPFVDLDIRESRVKFVNQTLIDQSVILLRERLGNVQDPDFSERLIMFLAEVMAENHALRAAYIEQSRYRDPNFSIPMPHLPEHVAPSVFEIDLRAEITGGNWHGAETDGRWAGPENESSVFLPSMQAGQYDLQIDVTNEIETGIIDQMKCTFNRKEIVLTRDNSGIPTVLRARVEVDENHRFPFHVLKFAFTRLRSPAEFGSRDSRRLAICVKSVCLTRVDV